MKKRILSVLLAVLILCSVLTPAAFADDGHIITFDPREIEGGSLNGAEAWRKVPDGQPVGAMPVPTNSNPKLSFEGWFDDEHNEITAETILKNDVVVHAYWMEKQMTVPFTDISGHWAYKGIEFCYENSLMKGMTDTTFGPELTTTRAMVVTVLYRMENTPPVGGLDNPFKDVEFGDWYGSAVVWAADCGIVNGVSKDTFDPNSNITREQLAAILYRYADYCGYCTDIKYTLDDFKDKDKISKYAVEPMQWTYAMNLITGVFEGKFNFLKPQENATRAQIATILMRFMENVVPHETVIGFDGLNMTLPASWFNEFVYEAMLNEDGSSSMNLYCRREMEAGNGGLLFSINIVDGAIPYYATAYKVVGAIGKDGEYRNVIIVFPGGVECGEYVGIYSMMQKFADHIADTFVCYDGWHFGVG